MTTPLQQAAQALINRWGLPAWRDQPHTAEYIAQLHKALVDELAQSVEPVGWAVYSGILDMRKHRIWDERGDAEEAASTIKSYTEIRPIYLHPPQPQATTPAVLKRLSDEAKRGLVGAWFSEDWAQKAAYGMLDDFETAQGEKP